MAPVIVLLVILGSVACIALVASRAGRPRENRPPRGTHASSLMVGLVIVGVGVVLLLDQLGYLEARDVFRFWPVILIAIGLEGIFRARESSKVVARGLVGLFGVLLLLMELEIIHVSFHEIWPVFIIAAGVLMIWGALRPSYRWGGACCPPGVTSGGTTSSPHLNIVSIFSDGNWTVTAPDFENGFIRAVFGGFKVDLTQADMTGTRAYINLDVVFAGGEIRIPNSWNLQIEARPVFGACEDKTRRLQSPGAAKTLVLAGKVVFGGIEVRN